MGDTKITKHCWKDYRTHLEEIGKEYSPEWAATYDEGGNSTCMLEHGHEGEHEWTNDHDIVITFKG